MGLRQFIWHHSMRFVTVPRPVQSFPGNSTIVMSQRNSFTIPARLFQPWAAGVRISYFALIIGCAGCTQLAEFRNPFAGPPPAYKSEYGLSPAEKADQLRGLVIRAKTMSRPQQDATSQDLTRTLGTVQDAILRREIIRALGAFPTQHAAQGLHQAAEDEDPLVRIAAAEAWGMRHDREAESVLSSLLTTDPNVDVRQAAIRALATFGGADTLHHLSIALQDRDPAIQLAAIQALKSTTGQDLGNDVNKWIAYAKASAPSTPGSPTTSDASIQMAQPAANGSATR